MTTVTPAEYKGAHGRMEYDVDIHRWRVVLVTARFEILCREVAEAMLLCDMGTNCIDMFHTGS